MAKIIEVFDKIQFKNKKLKKFLRTGLEVLYPSLSKDQQKIFWDLLLTFVHKVGGREELQKMGTMFSALQVTKVSKAKSVGKPSAFAPVGGTFARGARSFDPCPDCPSVPEEIIIAGLGSDGSKKVGSDFIPVESAKDELNEIVVDDEDPENKVEIPEWNETPVYDDPEHPEDANSLEQLRRIVRVDVGRPPVEIVNELRAHMTRAGVEWNPRLSSVNSIIDEFFKLMIEPKIKS